MSCANRGLPVSTSPASLKPVLLRTARSLIAVTSLTMVWILNACEAVKNFYRGVIADYRKANIYRCAHERVLR